MTGSSIATAEPVLAELHRARANTDALFAAVRPGALYERPIPERHRLIFYVGHLEAFDWNMLCRRTLGMASFHPSFDNLFEFGIDPPEGQLPADSAADWPSIDEVRRYNARVRAEIDAVIDRAPAEVAAGALEHRLMHSETLAYLLHNLPVEDKPGIGPDPPVKSGPARPEMIRIPSGRATLGQAPGEFGWDNEFERHAVEVREFAIGRYKVTNAEYLQFVEQGGETPHYWMRAGGDWFYRGMAGPVVLHPDWPVYTTYEQAAAYAKFRGANLPSEDQFHRAAYGTPSGEERAFPWGSGEPDARHGNFDFARWDPVPVTANPAGDSAFGVSQMVGNGWEWTSSAFAPFEGFRTFSWYPGYSKNFFDGEHFVMKGGSPRTATRLLRRSFRNWFRRRYPYVYGTFRLVED